MPAVAGPTTAPVTVDGPPTVFLADADTKTDGQKEGKKRDFVGRLADLNNAIVADDCDAVRDIVQADPALIDVHMPDPRWLAEWVAPVLMPFHAHVNVPTSGRFRTYGDWPKPMGAYEERYVPVLPTPLMHAVDVGARRVLAALIAAGARPEPSVEALVNRAINHLYECRVNVHTTCMHEVGFASLCAAEPASESRMADWLGILGDLLRAFGRTRPSFGPFDANPLFVLRVTSLHRANSSIDFEEPRTAFGDDETVKRLCAALDLLLKAGYSPDEIMSETPQELRFTGFDGSRHAGPVQVPSAKDRNYAPQSSEAIDACRRNALVLTERQGAHLTSDLWRGHAEKEAEEALRETTVATILQAYDAVPLSSHSPPTPT